MIDSDRAAVYAAEIAAFAGTDLDRTRPRATIHALIEAVVGNPWWPGPPVALRVPRANTRSSTARCVTGAGSTVSIAIADEQLSTLTAAHEIAHALAGPEAGHGPTFRAAYLDVVAVITNISTVDRRGTLHVQQLVAAFNDAGLVVGARRWLAPPPSTTGAIAL